MRSHFESSAALDVSRTVVEITWWLTLAGVLLLAGASSWRVASGSGSCLPILASAEARVSGVPLTQLRGDDPAGMVRQRTLDGSSADPARFGVSDVSVDDVRATVTYRPGPMLSALALAPAVFFATLWLLGLHHLRRLLRDVREGTIFTLGNARRISQLGLLILASAVSLPLFRFLQGVILSRGFTSETIHFVVETPPVEIVFLGLFTLVLSQIWRYGVELQGERDLTV